MSRFLCRFVPVRLVALLVVGGCTPEELTCTLLPCPPTLTVRLVGQAPPAPWRIEVTRVDGTPISTATCESNAPTPCFASTQAFLPESQRPDRVTVRIVTANTMSVGDHVVQYEQISPNGSACGSCSTATLTIPWR